MVIRWRVKTFPSRILPLVLTEYLSYLLSHILLALFNLLTLFLLSFEFLVEFILNKLLAFLLLFAIGLEIFLIGFNNCIVALIVFHKLLCVKFDPIGYSLLMQLLILSESVLCFILPGSDSFVVVVCEKLAALPFCTGAIDSFIVI